MSETPDPIAPHDAPKTSLQQIIESVVQGLKELIPSVALGVAVPMLIAHQMPDSNEKVMLTVIGALAGFLTGRATAPKGSGGAQ